MLVRIWLAFVAVLLAAPAQAEPFTNVFFFGDSTTDTGNSCVLDPGDRACRAPAFFGRASNGPVWAEYFAANLGASARAALAPGTAPPVFLPSGGTNFAVGGADTTQLSTEIAVYRQFFPTTDPNALYAIWMGGNDIRDVVRGRSSITMPQAVSNVIGAVNALQAAGAQHFLVALLPDTGRSADLSPEQSRQASALTVEFNRLLGAALTGRKGVDITQLDVYSLVEDIARRPAAYGLTQVTTPCLRVPACAADPMGPISRQFLLADEIHFTTAGHAIVAAAATAALARVPAPAPSALLLIGAGAAALTWRRRSEAA